MRAFARSRGRPRHGSATATVEALYYAMGSARRAEAPAVKAAAAPAVKAAAAREVWGAQGAAP
ncbi:hypothetical protein [Dactylosporangium sp. CA-139066]|uniref:hypothetical protein n=1 Tax=Dactylosporangium sp. CA-139066 TaxID=3239930 RepID=UPI003D8ACED6